MAGLAGSEQAAGGTAAGETQADRDHRTGPGPVLTIHPADTPADSLPSGYVLTKRHSTIVLSWPEAARQGKQDPLRAT